MSDKHRFLNDDDGRYNRRPYDDRDPPPTSYYQYKYEEEVRRRREVESELAILKNEQQQTGIETPENSIAEVKKLSTRRKLIIHNNYKQHAKKTEICT